MFRIGTFTELSSLTVLGYLYPFLAGICITFGCFLVFTAFQKTTTKTKLQEAIVAILANGELIPLLFLSYLKDSPYGKLFPSFIVKPILREILRKNIKNAFRGKGAWIFIVSEKET